MRAITDRSFEQWVDMFRWYFSSLIPQGGPIGPISLVSGRSRTWRYALSTFRSWVLAFYETEGTVGKLSRILGFSILNKYILHQNKATEEGPHINRAPENRMTILIESGDPFSSGAICIHFHHAPCSGTDNRLISWGLMSSSAGPCSRKALVQYFLFGYLALPSFMYLHVFKKISLILVVELFAMSG